MKACEAVELLNKLLDEQPDFTTQIINARYGLSESFRKSDLPFVCGIAKDGNIQMGVIGMMNGIVSDGRIAASFDDDMKLIEFVVIS